MSINEVTYGNEYISLLRDSTLSNELNFRFYLFYCNRKEKDNIRRKINSKKNILETSIVINLIYRKLGLVGPVQEKIKLPLPNISFNDAYFNFNLIFIYGRLV